MKEAKFACYPPLQRIEGSTEFQKDAFVICADTDLPVNKVKT
jgi:hypothetical protein